MRLVGDDGNLSGEVTLMDMDMGCQIERVKDSRRPPDPLQPSENGWNEGLLVGRSRQTRRRPMRCRLGGESDRGEMADGRM